MSVKMHRVAIDVIDSVRPFVRYCCRFHCLGDLGTTSVSLTRLRSCIAFLYDSVSLELYSPCLQNEKKIVKFSMDTSNLVPM